MSKRKRIKCQANKSVQENHIERTTFETTGGKKVVDKRLESLDNANFPEKSKLLKKTCIYDYILYENLCVTSVFKTVYRSNGFYFGHYYQLLFQLKITAVVDPGREEFHHSNCVGSINHLVENGGKHNNSKMMDISF